MKIKPEKQLTGQMRASDPQSLAACCRETALRLAILAALYPSFAYANPDGAQIVSGQVSIDTATAGVTTVTNSPNAIINWQNFSIAQNELTQFIQQNGQSAVLNRIIGQNPSEILGQLASNGKVFLINPNGIVFGAGSAIDTQGLIASSLNLSDQDFLSGNYHFMAGPTAGNILNEGIIRAGKDGNIVLIAPQIQNNGIINSDGGAITLAAGHELTITNLDDPEIRFQIQAPADSVVNLGKLLTEGGAVNVFANTIHHSGEINADSVEVDAQGNVRLVAEHDITLASGSKISANNSHGDAGAIHVDSKTGTTLAHGTIEAKATHTGKGGSIELLGEQVGMVDQAKIDASGEMGGGQVLIGGDYQGKNADAHNAEAIYIGKDATIKADAKSNGDGGKVIAWSDRATRVYGNLSAKGGSLNGDGGFIETSGHWLDTTGIKINASAFQGRSGNWLLDPHNITINATGPTQTGPSFPNWTAGANNSVILNTDIDVQLNNGTNVTIYTGGAVDAQAGNITVEANIGKTAGADATLHLKADNAITINSNVSINSTNNKLNVILNADADSSGAGNIVMNSGSSITSNGGDITFGGGASPLTTAAYGVGANTNGVQIDNASLNAGSGNIALRGAGMSGTSNTNGIYISSSSHLTTTSGSIILNGTGGQGTSDNYGVYLNGALSTAGGQIVITGTGQGTGANNFGIFSSNSTLNTGTGDLILTGSGGYGTDLNSGIVLSSTNLTTDGTVSINGYGNGSGSTNVGVLVSSSNIRTGTGNLNVSGTGGNGTDSNVGIITQNSTLESTGTGNLTLNGTSGYGTNSNLGVILSNSNLLTQSGTLGIMGTSRGVGNNNVGILNSSSSVSTGTGSLNLDGSGTGDAGIYLGSGAVIGSAAQTGDITLSADTVTGSDSIVMTGATTPVIKGSGTLTFRPLYGSSSIGLADGAGVFNLSSTELSYIQNGFSNIIIGSNSDTGLITLGASGWIIPPLSDLILQNTGYSSAGMTIDGALTLGSGKNLFLNSAGMVTTNMPIDADSGFISLRAPSLAINNDVQAKSISLQADNISVAANKTVIGWDASYQWGDINFSPYTYNNPLIIGAGGLIDNTQLSAYDGNGAFRSAYLGFSSGSTVIVNSAFTLTNYITFRAPTVTINDSIQAESISLQADHIAVATGKTVAGWNAGKNWGNINFNLYTDANPLTVGTGGLVDSTQLSAFGGGGVFQSSSMAFSSSNKITVNSAFNFSDFISFKAPTLAIDDNIQANSISLQADAISVATGKTVIGWSDDHNWGNINFSPYDYNNPLIIGSGGLIDGTQLSAYGGSGIFQASSLGFSSGNMITVNSALSLSDYISLRAPTLAINDNIQAESISLQADTISVATGKTVIGWNADNEWGNINFSSYTDSNPLIVGSGGLVNGTQLSAYGGEGIFQSSSMDFYSDSMITVNSALSLPIYIALRAPTLAINENIQAESISLQADTISVATGKTVTGWNADYEWGNINFSLYNDNTPLILGYGGLVDGTQLSNYGGSGVFQASSIGFFSNNAITVNSALTSLDHIFLLAPTLTINNAIQADSISLNADMDIFQGASGGGKITNNAALSANDITLRAGKMALAGSINAGNSVNLLTSNAIHLGTVATDDTANTLELSNAELSTITAPTLRIGDNNSGNIDIKSALMLTNNISAALNLTSGGAITQQAGAIIGVLPGLNLSGTTVELTEANSAGVISGSVSAGNFKYYSSSQLTVSTVDGVSGITAASAYNIGLKSDVGINQHQGADINTNGGGLALKTQGSVDLSNKGNKISTLAAKTFGQNFTFNNSQDLTIGQLTGGTAPDSYDINGIDTCSIIGSCGNISLTVNGLVSQSAPLKAAGLELLGLNATYILDNANNTITTLAGNTGTLSFTGSNFDIGTVNSTIGLATAGDVTLNASGTIAASEAVTVEGIFTLGSGTWSQVGNSLPSFYAKDFRIDGGAFLRALGGDGSSETPYQLTDIYGVQGMGSDGMQDNSYVLANNIDAANTKDWYAGAGFMPISSNGEANFTGTFDGLGHTLSNLTINRPSQNDVGLFARMYGSISNVGLINAVVTGGDIWVGALASINFGTINNVYATGNVSGVSQVGGLVGDNNHYNGNSAVISNAYFSGNVSGRDGSPYYASVGGLVGINAGGIIRDSYATGNVTGVTQNVGGLVGWNYVEDSNASITNSYSTGKVSSTAGSVGGLVGLNDATITNSFWNIESSGQADLADGRGTGLTTAQMQNMSSFTGWDIANTGGSSAVWRIYEGSTTPLLRSFLTALTVTAKEATQSYNGEAYSGGNGVSYSVENPELSGSLAYGGTAQGAINAGSYTLAASGYYSYQQGYDISYIDSTLTIDPARLNIYAVSVSKTYDGTADSSGVVAYTGLQGDDSFLNLSQSYASKDVLGTNLSALRVDNGFTLDDGNSGGNYIVTIHDALGSITPAGLNIYAVSDSKTYDGTADSSGVVAYSGLQGDDSVLNLSQSYASKNVLGTNLSTLRVDNGFTLDDGNSGGNYTVTIHDALGSITPAGLDIYAVSDSKTYDGGTGSTGVVAYSGLQGDDSFLNLSQSYASKDVLGTNLSTLQVDNSFTLDDGNSGGNYTITTYDALGTITPLSSVAWTGNAGTGLWSTAGNWENNIIPTTGNVLEATIPSGFIVTYDSLADFTKLTNFSSLGHFQMTGGSLEISSDFDTAQFTQSGGSLSANSFNVGNAFSQSGGTITANDVFIYTIGDLSQTAGNINTTTFVANSATGAVTLAGSNVFTGDSKMTIDAGGDIYSRSQGVSQISSLNAPNGSIDVENIGGFILGSTALTPGTTVANAANNVKIKALSPLTVNGAVSSKTGSVSLTASNGDILSLNAPITAAGGIALEGGTLTGNNADSFSQYFNTGTSTQSTIQTTTQDSINEITRVVVATTTPSGQSLTSNSSTSNNDTGESTDTTENKNKNSKQCTK
jgi:filamentous hemagglutinin family protein